MLTAVLALMASVSWGTSDFLAGLRSRRLPLLTVLLVSQAAGLVSISALVAARGEGPPVGAPLLYAALAGVAGTVGITALYRGLAVGAMSIVAPISAASGVVPVAVGLATGERPTLPQGLGIALAIVGVVLASRAVGDRRSEGSVAAGVGLACLAALAFGLLLVALDAASRGDALWGTLILRGTALGLFASAALVVWPSLSLERRDMMTLLAVGVLDTGANALFATAATRGLLSLVSVLAQLYPVVTVLLRQVRDRRAGRSYPAGGIGRGVRRSGPHHRRVIGAGHGRDRSAWLSDEDLSLGASVRSGYPSADGGADQVRRLVRRGQLRRLESASPFSASR